MPSQGAAFSHLHQLHLQLKDVQDKLARGPRQIKVRQRKIADAEESVSAKEAELKEVRAQSDRKNLDLRSKEAHLRELQAKLNAAASNREFDIIRGQIEADNAAKAVLEDEILEYLERADGLQAEVIACRQLVKEAEEDARSFATDFEQRAVTLQEDETRLKAAIAESESVIPQSLKERYRRLTEAYGADGMAAVEKGACTHCFTNLTPQSAVAVESGTLIECKSCGRLLYADGNSE